MTRITPEHLSRAAWVYVRQSTPSQVRHHESRGRQYALKDRARQLGWSDVVLVANHESRGRQYALKDRARQLGWSDVVLVDDDLGRSGGGTERAMTGCWRQCVAAKSERCCLWRRPGWLGTDASGIP